MKKKKEMLISRRGQDLEVALLEDGKLAEIYIEKEGKRSIVGNIYLGVITTVLPGMSAAFIDIGTGKSGLLYLEDLILMEDGTHIKQRKITRVLKANDSILVQVTKDPIGGKGARLTTGISLPGRLMVYMPYGKRLGVSKKLKERERDRLRKIAEEIKPKTGSTIIRTAACGAKKQELTSDLRLLEEEWEKIKNRISHANPPARLYAEPDLAVKLVRDSFSREFSRLYVDSRTEYESVMDYLSIAAPELKGRVELYTQEVPLLEKYGIRKEIEAALRRRVTLPSGGYLVIDEAEALTAIDVNTGSYTGKKSLEDTVLRTNLEAAQEVVRQLRLRDIGGIIVIDFIDMENRQNRERVLKKLEEELSRDRTKTQIVTLSRLGLVEMTRKNVTEGISGILGRTCRECGGTGRVFDI